MVGIILPIDLEKTIIDYENAVLGNSIFWNYLDLQREMYKYFDQFYNKPSMIDTLFNRFTPIWNILHKIREFDKACTYWDVILDFTDLWESKSNKQVHKGSPFYFKAMSAIAGGDIDFGFLLFHQSLEEDKRTFGIGTETPALRFVTLDLSSKEQAAYELVKLRSDLLDEVFGKYRKTNRGYLSLEDFQTKALKRGELIETTFSFVHSVFRYEKIRKLPIKFRSTEFASQLMIDIAFSLCRIAELLLKNIQTPSQRNEYQLGGQLYRFASNQSGLLLSPPDLNTINSMYFDISLDAILSNNISNFPKMYCTQEQDMLIIYLIRNHGGHGVGSSNVILDYFQDIIERIFFGIFFIVEKLY